LLLAGWPCTKFLPCDREFLFDLRGTPWPNGCTQTGSVTSGRPCATPQSMTFAELKHFLEARMRQSHVYQPVLIRALVDSGGSATVRQLATIFVQQDESQLLYYERTIKAMPVKVLEKHGVVTRTGELISLSVGRLTLEQRAEIKRLCETKLQEFIARRGIKIWDYRMLDFSAVADELRYRVLKEARGRCALCGASVKDVPLDVDHILPRSRKGATAYENLQALCAKCNRTKRNQDATDFRGYGVDYEPMGVPFFEKPRLLENRLAFAVLDGFPVSPGHTLLVPKRHFADAFEITGDEMQAVWNLARVRTKQLKEEDAGIKGFNFGVNAGEAAGQTVMHCHFHLIPRRPGDTPSPRGGVRGVIPTRMNYGGSRDS